MSKEWRDEAELWRRNYLTLADAVCEGSTSLDDACRQAWDTRKRATAAELEVASLRSSVEGLRESLQGERERADGNWKALRFAMTTLRDVQGAFCANLCDGEVHADECVMARMTLGAAMPEQPIDANPPGTCRVSAEPHPLAVCREKHARRAGAWAPIGGQP